MTKYPNYRDNPAGSMPVYVVAGPGNKAIPVNFLTGPGTHNSGPVPVRTVTGPGTPPIGNDQGINNNAIPVYSAGFGMPVWDVNPPPPPISVNTTLPSITPIGTQPSGTTLTANPGIWTNNPTSYLYQWTRNGGNIAGATTSTYVSVVADRNTSIRVIVIAVNAGGESAPAQSSNSVQILGVPANVTLPSISPVGPVNVGDTLTVSNGTWTNSPTNYYYGWTRGGVSIPSANTNTYVTVVGDSGTSIGAVVQAANSAGGGIAVSSSNTVNVT